MAELRGQKSPAQELAVRYLSDCAALIDSASLDGRIEHYGSDATSRFVCAWPYLVTGDHQLPNAAEQLGRALHWIERGAIETATFTWKIFVKHRAARPIKGRKIPSTPFRMKVQLASHPRADLDDHPIGGQGWKRAGGLAVHRPLARFLSMIICKIVIEADELVVTSPVDENRRRTAIYGLVRNAYTYPMLRDNLREF